MHPPYHSGEFGAIDDLSMTLADPHRSAVSGPGDPEDARQVITQATPRSGMLAYWHLLSLDAPTVAVLWTWFVARAASLTLPNVVLETTFLAVWVIYAADRLLDVRRCAGKSDRSGLEARHLFHLQHRRLFCAAIVLATLALVPLITALPAAVRNMYLVAGLLLALWFGLIHRGSRDQANALPKELAVGFFFSAVVFIPTLAQHGSLVPSLLVQAVLFANLCSLNCLFIFAWEHKFTMHTESAAHSTTRFGVRFLKPFAILACSVPVLLLVDTGAPIPLLREPAPLLLALALAALLLLLLHLSSTKLSRVTLRSLADVALLTPLLISPWLR